MQHGGKRQGAGRKPSEVKKRVYVPVRLLDTVQGLIAGTLNLIPEIKSDSSGSLVDELQRVKEELDAKNLVVGYQSVKILELEERIKARDASIAVLQRNETKKDETKQKQSSKPSKRLVFDDLNTAQKAEFFKLERLPTSERDKIIKQYGSLSTAVASGVKASGKGFLNPKS